MNWRIEHTLKATGSSTREAWNAISANELATHLALRPRTGRCRDASTARVLDRNAGARSVIVRIELHSPPAKSPTPIDTGTALTQGNYRIELRDAAGRRLEEADTSKASRASGFLPGTCSTALWRNLSEIEIEPSNLGLLCRFI